ncbi:MAG: formimidoylglutamate deiminase [bacterium]
MVKNFRARWIYWENVWVENATVAVADDQILGLTDAEDVTDLGDKAIIPGFINTHSHAFQRAIRGRTEHVLSSRLEDDFWTWRDAMYESALTFGPEDMHRVATLAYQEMVAAGITTVVEFHYVHHAPDGSHYADRNALAHAVVRAATEVGLRIVILPVAYQRGGFEKPAERGQRRFIYPSVDAYLRAVDELADHYKNDSRVTVGVAPHSIRAVEASWMTEIAAYADERGLPVHIHACEQRREIQESIAEYGYPPIFALAEMGVVTERTTLVHGTHLTRGELDLLGQIRPTIAACPTTERNLGDGFLPAKELVERGIPIALGTDSNATINLFEDMRLVEYHERLRYERRNVLATSIATLTGRPRVSTGDVVFPMATLNGARSAGLFAGVLKPGALPDLVAIDLQDITVCSADRKTCLPRISSTISPCRRHPPQHADLR